MVDKRPFTTQIITTGVLCSCGDILAQTIERRSTQKDFEPKRTAIMATIGLCLFGPICSLSLRLLHSYKFSPLASVAIDQTLTSPIINTSFCTIHPLLSGVSWEEVKSTLWERWSSVQINSYYLWIPAQLFNFSVVPYQFRLLFLQSVALLWNVFLSYLANNNVMEAKIKEQQNEKNK